MGCLCASVPHIAFGMRMDRDPSTNGKESDSQNRPSVDPESAAPMMKPSVDPESAAPMMKPLTTSDFKEGDIV